MTSRFSNDSRIALLRVESEVKVRDRTMAKRLEQQFQLLPYKRERV
jgi:hypothetical protein